MTDLKKNKLCKDPVRPMSGYDYMTEYSRDNPEMLWDYTDVSLTLHNG